MKRIIHGILLVLNILFALALIFSYLSVHINPDVFALPALFGLAYPYLLFMNIVFMIIWAVLIRWEILISLVVIAAGFTHFSNYIKLKKPAGEKTGTFTLVSYNVRLFNHFEENQNSLSEKKIIDLLKNIQADIICLQEIYIIGDPLAKEREIKKALGGQYYSHLKVISSGRNRYFGIATFSRFPIVGKGDIVHEKSSSLSIYTDIVKDHDTIRIFNNHLQSFHLNRMERKLLNELAGSSDNKEALFEIWNISVSLLEGFVKRSTQAQKVKEVINESSHPVIVAGDFNDTPVSYSYRKIRKGLNDAFVSSGYGAGFTYRGNYPPNRIDYILYSGEYECTWFDIRKVKYSDHYPISANFRQVARQQ